MWSAVNGLVKFPQAKQRYLLLHFRQKEPLGGRLKRGGKFALRELRFIADDERESVLLDGKLTTPNTVDEG